MIKTAQQKETWPEMGGTVEKNRRKSRKSRLAPILAKPVTPEWSDHLRPFALAQTSCGGVDRAADCFPGYNEFHSAIFLPPRGIVVRGNRHGVAETSSRNRIPQDSFLHQVVPHCASTIFR